MPLPQVTYSKGCRTCKKAVEAFHTINYKDLTGWCSQECFEKDAEKALAKEVEKKQISGIRVM